MNLAHLPQSFPAARIDAFSEIWYNSETGQERPWLGHKSVKNIKSPKPHGASYRQRQKKIYTTIKDF